MEKAKSSSLSTEEIKKLEEMIEKNSKKLEEMMEKSSKKLDKILSNLNNFKDDISETTKSKDYGMDREAWRIYDELQRTRMMSGNIISGGAVAVGRSPRREYDFPLSRPGNVYNGGRRGGKSVNSFDTHR